jgi:cobalamin biosynthesis protein CobW
MQSAVVRLDGPFERSRLEQALQAQIRVQQLLRLKGRAWLPGKRHPLQIQAVGPRLECWFDSQAPAERPDTDGLELVALGLAVDGGALEQELLA